LVGAVQGYEADEYEARAIVRVHIRRLRQKLESDPADPEYILNVRGVGYLFASAPPPS
jgi:DNA-binding response OmpR family regulator